ncbi:MAG: ABC transporter ATP-binding protein [Polyangiaceae bacterium]
MAKLELSGVSRKFPNTRSATLERLDLTVESGEVLVLVGPSGCGKSTTLRLVAGLDAPDAGRITLDGRDLASVAPQERDIAMVFQGYALYPHMTAAENIAFCLKMQSVARADRDRRVAEVAELLGIEKLLARLPGELSGGERQRVAMGRALVRKPKLFLFDEPLSNLDAALRTTLRVEIARLLRRVGATAIYVTHDQIEAMTVGDRIAVMRAGRVEQLGKPREIYTTPATTFVAGFLGSPPINLIDVTVRGADAETASGARVPAPAGAADGAKLVVGARPEHVELVGAAGAPQGALELDAKIVALEPLGERTVIHLEDAAGTALRALGVGFAEHAVGDSTRVAVATERLRWFDRASGRAHDLASGASA